MSKVKQNALPQKMGILSSKKIGKEIFYIHTKLFDLFKDM
jgi:hypothetical protein